MRKVAFLFFLALILHSYQIEKKFSLKQALTASYKFIPSGNVMMNGDTISVQAFYIYEKEITNLDYREFLLDLKNNGEFEKLKIAQVDSMKWNMSTGENAAYVKYYHSHPAYNEYPVINISHEAAGLYCKWLGEKYDKKYGVKGRFLFRLMEKAEYIRACRGDSDATYAWGSHSLHNNKGQPMCNFTRLSAEHIHLNFEKKAYEIKVDKNTSTMATGVDVLATSKSYWPNIFKVYNLNGNAAEMIAQKGIAVGGSWRDPGYDVRVESERTYDGPNPLTGFRVVITSVDNWSDEN
jgi:formylglycine-generating enzyme required for sulfatase activity